MDYDDLGMFATPVDTAVIRTPATGPDPLNVLAFVRFRAAGAVGELVERDKLYRVRVSFLTKFIIDGFSQAQHDWYVANTLVSATCSLTAMNEVDDTGFVMAIDAIRPFIDLSGALGFTVDHAIQSGELCSLSMKGSAYVACFEPARERPRTHSYRQSGSLPAAALDQRLWPRYTQGRPSLVQQDPALRMNPSKFKKIDEGC
jgi:hypothetical protein